MTREETKMWLDSLKKVIGKPQHQELWHYAEAIDIAIEALKAQDRPIICPRCGRTFAESEGRE